MSATVDLREGFRIEVEPMVTPRGEFGARLYLPKNGRWARKHIGHMVIADTPEKAAQDMLKILNEGLMPGVEVLG